MKKILSLTLAIVLVFSFLSFNVLAQSYDPSSYKLTGNARNDIIGIAKTQIGYKPTKSDCTKYAEDLKSYGASNPNQWCGYFISWCALKANILNKQVKYLTGVASAKKAGTYYTTSQVFNKKYTPQKGDIVVYGSSSTANGSHVGLVSTNATLSNGKLTFGTIEGNSGNDDVFTRTRTIRSSGYVSTNWYIVGFVSLPYKTSTPPIDNTTPVNPPKINITSYPTSIKKGSSYGLRGSVNANGLSTEVRGYILNSKGKTVQSSKVQKTSSSNFDIKNSNVNNQLCFDKLSKGTYTLKITAKNKKGSVEFKKDFTVITDEGTKPVINLTSYPTSIKKGSNYGLRGLINANGSSTEIRGYIINSKGKTVQSSKVQKTTSSSFNIKNSNVNNQLLFNKLGKGTYTLKITAKNKAGTTTVTKKFTVK